MRAPDCFSILLARGTARFDAGRRLGPRALAWLALLSVSGCDSSSSDLPAGWQGAQKIADFTQMECGGSPINGPAESVDAAGVEGAIEVDYENAPFRCAQDVEGFVRREDGKLDILIQPVDMDPSSVAKCDCLYHIVATVPAEAGAHAVTVYRRWDHRNDPNDPVEVGMVEVESHPGVTAESRRPVTAPRARGARSWGWPGP